MRPISKRFYKLIVNIINNPLTNLKHPLIQSSPTLRVCLDEIIENLQEFKIQIISND